MHHVFQDRLKTGTCIAVIANDNVIVYCI